MQPLLAKLLSDYCRHVCGVFLSNMYAIDAGHNEFQDRMPPKRFPLMAVGVDKLMQCMAIDETEFVISLKTARPASTAAGLVGLSKWCRPCRLCGEMVPI